MVKDLNKAELELLGRIMMRQILSYLDESDFSSVQKDESGYAHPHLGVSAGTLFIKFYNKLSPERKQGFDNNAELVMVSTNPALKETEIPYWQAKVQAIKSKNGGHIVNGRQQAKTTNQTAGQNSSAKSKK